MEPASLQQNREEASRFMRLAITQMQKYQIPNTPENYQVWYQYVSGSNQKLSTRINQLIKAASQFSPAIIKELQALTHVPDEQLMTKMQDQLRKLILELEQSLRKNDNQMASEVSRINSNAQELQPFASERVVNRVSKELVKATQTLEKVVERQRHDLEAAGTQLAELGEIAQTGHQPDDRDFLTGLVTRISFEKQLQTWLTSGHNELKHVCIGFIEPLELDHLRNKTNALVVDDVLRYTAIAIKAAIRGRDLAARIDQQRFALLLPDTELTGAQVVINRIFEAFPEQGLKQKSNRHNIGRIRVAATIMAAAPHLSIDQINQRLDRGIQRASFKKGNGFELIS
ncbi:MAG: GGDEF domain-containing protein [bacterium]